MGATADELRQQVDANRSSAEDKIHKIEQQVTESAQLIQEKVADSASVLQEKVVDSAAILQEKVVETAQQVKEQFDWRKQVNDRPLVAVGTALIGGMLLGKVAGGQGGGNSSPNSGQGAVGGGMIGGAIQNAMQKSGLADTLETTMSDLFSSVTERMKAVAKDLPGMDSNGASDSAQNGKTENSGVHRYGSAGETAAGR